MPTTSRGRSTSTTLDRASSHARKSSARSAAGSLSGGRFLPESSMNTSGHQFATKTCSKNRSALPKRSRAQPQNRVPLTSERVQSKPFTGRRGCSRAGRPTCPVDPDEVAHHHDVAERNARLRHAERPRVHADHHHLPRRLRPPALEVCLVGRTRVGERVVDERAPTGTEARRPGPTARG